MRSKTPKVSIIFPVRNEGKNVRMTLDSLFSVKSNIEIEAIIVDDASTDQCCSFLTNYQYQNKVTYVRTDGIGPANARNLGAEKAQYQYLAFCDAHMTFENFWIDRLVNHIIMGKSDAVCPAIGSIADPTIKGYGQSLTPSLKIKWHQKRRFFFETPVLPGACIIISRRVFNEIGGFETGFSTWGHEDVEISLKLWLFGYKCHCDPQISVLHLFRTSHPYNVNFDGVYYNLLRMAYLHFDDKRIKKAKSLVIHGSASAIEKKVIKDGVLRKRALYIRKRKMDIEDLFKKFNIYF
ncbi:glycosyltransferase [Bacillus sp. es.034]|uniref:glycosyltransferase family 2 protein n=1 Tax=Bacillus sp. es.034 TaxID=1761763 RepID=UPI000BFA4462|nr:glycosyltransferase [Bacillus sp. es.034]PFG06626.1 GT2 family glycosyltransferase [Bacillus sp. es.034]